MERLKGKVAIVTGAGKLGNIGQAVCEAFLKEGAAGVVAADLSVDSQETMEGQMAEKYGSGRFRLLPLDVTSKSGWRDLVEQVVAEFGQLDVLVNNAGLSIHGGISESSLENINRVMAVNHDALFLSMQVCLPYLEQAAERYSGGGSIINNLSMGSYMPTDNNVGYHVSKAAGRMLTLCAAQEFGAKGVRVNSVHPGVTMTSLMRDGIDDYVSRGVWDSVETAEASLAAMNPLNKLGSPEDTAHAFVYLASEESRYVTGSSLCHDAGMQMKF